MRSVSYRLADLNRVTVPLGFRGENEHTRVIIDCKKAFDEYPRAIPSLAVKNPDGTAYPAVIVREGDMVYWDVRDSDLVKEGRGTAQLTFTEDGVVRKDDIFNTVIGKSILPAGPAPDPVADWITEANKALGDVEHAIEVAEHAPVIDDNGYWAVWDSDAEEYVATEYKAQGEDADPTVLIDDAAGSGATGKTWSANKLAAEKSALSTDLMSAIGNSKIVLNDNSVYLTNTDPVTPSTSQAFKSILISCSPGEKFTINATGNNNAKPFAFVDNNLHKIYVSVSNKVRNGVVVVPSNATKLIINNNDDTLSSYYGEFVKTSIAKIENETQRPLFYVGYLGNNDGIYNPGQANGTSYSAVSTLFKSDYPIKVKSPSNQIRVFWYKKTTGEYVGNSGNWQNPPFEQILSEEYAYRVAIPFVNDDFAGCLQFCENAYNYITIEEMQALPPTKTVDLIIFMGQSNMAGRGVTSEQWPETAPTLDNGAGYEFRPISDPTKLYPIAEPFGVAENKTGAIDDGNAKTGSMVTAFANAYYSKTGVSIVAVSAAEGGTNSYSWRHGSARLNDAMQRFTDAIDYLTDNGYTIRHKYMIWCQGETDGSEGVTGETYKTRFTGILSDMQSVGVEKCFLCRIGEYNGTAYDYTEIITAQTQIAQENSDVIMATTVLAGYKEKGLMQDNYHYYQAAYNEMGTFSGINVSVYVNTGKEPTMYDPKNNNLYYSHKN